MIDLRLKLNSFKKKLHCASLKKRRTLFLASIAMTAHLKCFARALLILTAALSFFISPAASYAGHTNYNPPTAEINFVENQKNTFEVEKYIVWLKLYPQRHMISGEVEIYPVYHDAYSGEIRLYLHKDMDVRSIALTPPEPEFKYIRINNKIIITSKSKPEKIKISFYGDPSTYITEKNSFTYIGKEGCYFSDLCSYFPRAGFDSKSYFELFASVPSGWKTITQGELLTKNPGQAEGYVTYHHKTPKKTRCHTLAAGNYTVESAAKNFSKNFLISAYFSEKNAARSAEYISEASKILDFYYKNYGENNIDRLNIVEVEKVFPGGYGPEETVYITASAIEKRANKNHTDYELLSHEIAHQWFGNCVLGEFPHSNFLNEAFATYASMRYIEQCRHGDYHDIYEKMRRCYLAYRFMSGTNEISLADALESEARTPEYQEIVYYRGAMVLKMALKYLSDATLKTPEQMIKKYVSDHEGSILSLKEFKKYVFDKSSKLFSDAPESVDEKALRNASDLFDTLYNTTQAIELKVKGAVIDDAGKTKPGGLLIIERTDSIECDFAMTVLLHHPKLPANSITVKHVFKRGLNHIKFDACGINEFFIYEIDPVNDFLVSYKAPSLKLLTINEPALVIYATQQSDEKFKDYCYELAGGYSEHPIADIDASYGDLASHRKIILIGSQKNNLFIEKLAPFFPKSVLSEIGSNSAGSFVMANPFNEDSIIIIRWINDMKGAGRLNFDTELDDYAFANSSGDPNSPVKSGFYNYGAGGEFYFENKALKILSISAGIAGDVCNNAPAPFVIDIHNQSPETVEAILRFAPKKLYVEEPLKLPPKTITRHETNLYECQNEITFTLHCASGEIADEKQAYINSVSPSDRTGLICGGEAYSRAIIEQLSLRMYSAAFKNRIKLNVKKADFSVLPKNNLALENLDFILLHEYDFSKVSDEYIDLLVSYASSGGRVILTGARQSEAHSPRNEEFFKKIFGIRSKSSTIYKFDENPPGFNITPASKHEYVFEKSNWHEPQISYMTAKTNPGCRGDYPKFLEFNANGSAPNDFISQKLFDGKLFYSPYGRGAFYYVPYDISDNSIIASPENYTVLRTCLLSRLKWTNQSIGERLSPEDLLALKNEKFWPVPIEYFITYTLMYIFSIILIYRFLKKKGFIDYYIIILPLFFIAAALFTSISLFMIFSGGKKSFSFSITEFPSEYCGTIKQNIFFKLWSPNAKNFTAVCQDLKFYNWKIPNQYYNKINFANSKNGCELDVKNPPAFYPAMINIFGGAGQIPSRDAFYVSCALESESVKINYNNNVFKHMNTPAPAFVMLKTPGGMFTKKITASTNHLEFNYGELKTTEEAMVEAGSILGLDELYLHGLKTVIGGIDELGTDQALLFVTFEPHRTAIISANAKAVENINVIIAHFDYSYTKNTYIPDFLSHKKNMIIDGVEYNIISFNGSQIHKMIRDNKAGKDLRMAAEITLSPRENKRGKNNGQKYSQLIKRIYKNFEFYKPTTKNTIKYPFGETYCLLSQKAHDSDKNLEYNIADSKNIKLKINNLHHYLNLELFDESPVEFALPGPGFSSGDYIFKINIKME